MRCECVRRTRSGARGQSCAGVNRRVPLRGVLNAALAVLGTSRQNDAGLHIASRNTALFWQCQSISLPSRALRPWTELRVRHRFRTLWTFSRSLSPFFGLFVDGRRCDGDDILFPSDGRAPKCYDSN